MNSRYTMASGPTAPHRKSRADGKSSLIPKPKLSRQGSYDRLSETGWRPGRPRSLEPPRAGVPVGRQSREPSATKLPPGQRSRSAQQNEGWLMTPLNKPMSYSRTTTTPMRTPSTDRSARSWQNSMERVLAFVTVKDKRQISNVKWQKMTATRVNEELERRGEAGGAGGTVLMKPLTITRFVDITSGLLLFLHEKGRLESANYVTKLPYITKRILYPGAVSKSWLKTVNTLHTYPSALALIAYILDLVLRLESPVNDDTLYVDRGEHGRLRRDHLIQCWICFNEGSDQFTALHDNYLHSLRLLLGNDDDRVAQLEAEIQGLRLELEDPTEQVARADEHRRQDIVYQLKEAQRDLKSKRIQDKGRMDTACNNETTLTETNQQMQNDIERIQQELQQLKQEVAEQPLSTAERADLFDKVEYSNRVIDSKNDLVQQVSKMLQKTESDLALSQKHCLAACVEYNQHIISLTSSHGDCAGLAVEERDLMKSCTVEHVERSVSALRVKLESLSDTVKEVEKNRAASVRRLSEQNYRLEQVNAKLSDTLKCMEQCKREIRVEREESVGERERVAQELRELSSCAECHNKMAAELGRKEEELAEWEHEDREWQKRLQEMRDYVSEQREKIARRLDECKERRAAKFLDNVERWNSKLREISATYDRK